jgi:hypothetical protein
MYSYFLDIRSIILYRYCCVETLQWCDMEIRVPFFYKSIPERKNPAGVSRPVAVRYPSISDP